MIDVLRPMTQLSPMVTSSGWISSMYTNWPIQTFFPIAAPRHRWIHGRTLNPPGAANAILPASLLSRTGNINVSRLSYLVSATPEFARVLFAGGGYDDLL